MRWLIIVLLVSGCTASDVYFRGECKFDEYTLFGVIVYQGQDCSLPGESEVVELTGHEHGEVSEIEQQEKEDDRHNDE